LVLYGFRGDINSIPTDDFSRNVELLDKEGSLIWTIAAHPQNETNFVGLIAKGSNIEAINFYGVAYQLNLDTGEIAMLDWRK
jgi:hypothetical protein